MTTTRPSRSRLVAVSLVLVLALAGIGCSNGDATSTGGDHHGAQAGPATTSASTMGPPDQPADPGTLIGATSIDAPPGTKAWRISFHSRDLHDDDIAVTGLLIAPDDTTVDRPLITYGHPTTGSADACAPSSRGADGLPLDLGLTDRGWAVVMADYPGLGTADPHRYLVGLDEGRSLLDAARAVRGVMGTGVTPASPVAIVGFSQGGHAAAFAGELAPTYAPELPVRGVVLAAPVSDVEHFAARAERLPNQLGVLVTIVGGYARAYDELDPRTVLTDQAAAELDQLDQLCIGAINLHFDRPVDQVVRRPATTQDAYRTRFAENQAGRRPIPQPVLVLQGDQDQIIAPADSRALVERYCDLGTEVTEVVVAGANHGVMGPEPVGGWLTARFAGEDAGPTCGAA